MAKPAKRMQNEAGKAGKKASAKPSQAVSLAPTVKPPYRPKSFTMQQLRAAIAATRR